MAPRAASTVILVHGAWQGSWVWRDFVPFLNKAGFPTVAVDLPGNGADGRSPETATIDAYLGYLDPIIEACQGDIILVGHSGGGVVVTGAAQRWADRVDKIVYIAGMMLPSGMTFGELLAQENAIERGMRGIGDYLIWNAEHTISTVPPDAGARIFLNDMPIEKALLGAAQLTPQGEGGRVLAVEWTAERFGRLPRLYVECHQDLSVTLRMQQAMQSLVPGAMRVQIAAGHAPHISQPEVLADVLIPLL